MTTESCGSDKSRAWRNGPRCRFEAGGAGAGPGTAGATAMRVPSLRAKPSWRGETGAKYRRAGGMRAIPPRLGFRQTRPRTIHIIIPESNLSTVRFAPIFRGRREHCILRDLLGVTGNKDRILAVSLPVTNNLRNCRTEPRESLPSVLAGADSFGTMTSSPRVSPC